MSGARTRARVAALATVALLLLSVAALLATRESPAAAAGLNLTGAWQSTYHCATGWCAGQDFPDTLTLAQAVGSSAVTGTDPSGETVRGTLTGTTFAYTVTTGGYVATFTVTISAGGGSWSGNGSDNHAPSGTTGTETATRVGAPSAAPLYDMKGAWTGYAAGAPNSDALSITMDAAGTIGGSGRVSGEAFTLGGSEGPTGQTTLTLSQTAAQFPPSGYTSTDSGTTTENGNCFSGHWADSVGGPGHSGTFIWVRNGAAVTGAGTTASPYVCASTSSTTPGPLPAPVLGRMENVVPVSGTVLIKLPPGATLSRAADASASQVKGTGFVPLTQARQIPVGSILDTTGGTVAITAASPKKGIDYTGQFTAGVFRLLQHRQQKGLTELDLMDKLSRRAVCASAGKGAKASAAARRVSSKVLGLLKSTDHGRFSTRGAYSSASVRGTAYSVADTCAGTLTKVSRGTVVVDYFRRHRQLVVRAGQSFLALASGAPSAVVTTGKG